MMRYFFLLCLTLSKTTSAEFSNLLINTPANNCQDLFDYFGDTNLCDQTGYNTPKSGTIICENTFPACTSDDLTFCSLDDCCEKSEPVVGTCQDFFDSTSATVCDDNGFTGGNLDATTICNDEGCDLKTCCGPIAPTCQALFALTENPLGTQSFASVTGDYSCNTDLWLEPIDDWETFNSPAVPGDFLRSDCCVKKETCGLLFENLDGIELTCQNRGFGQSKETTHICDETDNNACTVSQCCEQEESCIAYNFLANDESLTGTAQTQQCQDNGYAYSQPFSRRPCYGGKCRHKDCCIRQRFCNAYSADNDRICQNQGYPFYESFDTDCFRGICDRSTCCTLSCDNGFDPFNRQCYNWDRLYGIRYEGQTWSDSFPLNYYIYPNFKDSEGHKEVAVNSPSDIEAYFNDYGITSANDADAFIIFGESSTNEVFLSLGFNNGVEYKISQFKFYVEDSTTWPLSTVYDGTSTVWWNPNTATTDSVFEGDALEGYAIV